MYDAAQHVAESVDDKCVSVPETAKKLLERGTGNEEAKINLSTSTSTEISLTWLAPDAKGNEHLIRTVTRDMLEKQAAPIVTRCREKCEETVRDSELHLDEIDHVLMVGGSYKIPCVCAMVKDYFGKKPSFIQAADQCVAIGAAIEGAIINGEINRMHLLDVTPLALGRMTQAVSLT